MTEWISVNEASLNSCISEKTVRKWIKNNEKNNLAVKRSGRRISINSVFFYKTYPKKQETNRSGILPEEFQNGGKFQQMQIVSHSETIKELSKQIERRDNEIKLLLNRKDRLPLWLNIGYIALILIILLISISGFIFYNYQQGKKQKEQLTTINNNNEREIEQIKHFTNDKITILKAAKEEATQTISQQRQELAEKDRLISELYNDTKAQNKKLLELTESLKNEVIKNKQKENTQSQE